VSVGGRLGVLEIASPLVLEIASGSLVLGIASGSLPLKPESISELSGMSTPLPPATPLFPVDMVSPDILLLPPLILLMTTPSFPIVALALVLPLIAVLLGSL